PDRSLEGERDGLRRLFQVYAREDGRRFNVWICASDERSWKHETLLEDADIEDLAGRLEELLAVGLARLFGWSLDDLSPRPIPPHRRP
ncbi:MAG TPA: hypothetical protein VE173_03525, partial [Longimicrobiales bacterium]|nr:hypothetical protein [Longimicrobiales bacterium]